MPVSNGLRDENEELFDRIDGNGDRNIRFEELASVMLEMIHARPRSALRACFEAIDANHDGRASFDEFRAWVTR